MDQTSQSTGSRTKKILWLIIAIGIVVVILAVVFGQRASRRKADIYEAVFLDNNQVYFGKLSELRGDFIKLTDIYYLRAGTVQKGEAGELPSQVDLIKLGSELHGPRDEMIINREHVIFYEEIGDQSEIRKLIRKDKGE